MSELPPELPAEVRDGTFVVIPAHNEAQCLTSVVEHVRAEYPNVVVVDDGSSDDTFKVAARSATYCLRHIINRGQGAALQTGIEFALRRGARYIVTFDADGQHQVEDIARLVEPIWHGRCEIALGSRFLKGASLTGMPLLRRLVLWLGVHFTRMFSRVRVSDTHNGLRAFSRKAAEHLNITLDGMAHASEIIDWIGRSRLPFQEAPVRIRYTDYSLAKGQRSRNAFKIVVQYLLGKVLP